MPTLMPPMMPPPRPAPAAAASAPPPPPMIPAGGYAPPVFAQEKAKAEHGDLGSPMSGVFASGVAPPASNPYLEQLGKLARELESLAPGTPNRSAMRMLRQRLTEWVEDLRSTGNSGDLAAAVEALVTRLTSAIAAPDFATEALAIARELAALAGGAPPPPAPKKSRAAFWK
jgi:hypothetical protein